MDLLERVEGFSWWYINQLSSPCPMCFFFQTHTDTHTYRVNVLQPDCLASSQHHRHQRLDTEAASHCEELFLLLFWGLYELGPPSCFLLLIGPVFQTRNPVSIVSCSPGSLLRFLSSTKQALMLDDCGFIWAACLRVSF